MASFTRTGVLQRLVKDLPGWAPQPGGSTKPGAMFPTSTDDVTIEHVLGYANGKLMFTCEFRGAPVSYDFPMLDESTANKVAAVLESHIGQTLTSIAFEKIPTDEAVK